MKTIELKVSDQKAREIHYFLRCYYKRAKSISSSRLVECAVYEIMRRQAQIDVDEAKARYAAERTK